MNMLATAINQKTVSHQTRRLSADVRRVDAVEVNDAIESQKAGDLGDEGQHGAGAGVRSLEDVGSVKVKRHGRHPKTQSGDDAGGRDQQNRRRLRRGKIVQGGMNRSQVRRADRPVQES